MRALNRGDGDQMTIRKSQDIWREQCEAAREIKGRYGLQASLDYLVGEKLLNYAAAATNHPEFARELPGFVAEVRRIFHANEIRKHLARIERDDREQASIQVKAEDDLMSETPTEVESRQEWFAMIKELLTEPQLGTA